MVAAAASTIKAATKASASQVASGAFASKAGVAGVTSVIMAKAAAAISVSRLK